VLQRSEKTLTILQNGRESVVSIDRVKPAYLDKPVTENSSSVFHPKLPDKETGKPRVVTRSGRQQNYLHRSKGISLTELSSTRPADYYSSCGLLLVLRITTRPADYYSSCGLLLAPLYIYTVLARDTVAALSHAALSLTLLSLSFSLSLALSRCYTLLFPRIHRCSTYPGVLLHNQWLALTQSAKDWL
ncbi:unnamed protein product, partial [Hymenolepis diminuta]